MYIIIKQYYNFSNDNYWYNNGYKNDEIYVFSNYNLCINFLKDKELYITQGFFQHELVLISNLIDLDTKNEIILYSLSDDFEIEDDDFYSSLDTIDYDNKTFKMSISDTELSRYILKKIEDGERIPSCETEQFKSKTFDLHFKIEVNESITTEKFIFRKDKEIEDLYFYWNNDNNNLNMIIPIIDDNDEEKEVHILEVAFWLLKTTKCNRELIWSIVDDKHFTLDMWNDIKMNTLFKNYTLDDAINELFSDENKYFMFDIIKIKKMKEKVKRQLLN
jgi:hypothetical protein